MGARALLLGVSVKPLVLGSSQMYLVYRLAFLKVCRLITWFLSVSSSEYIVLYHTCYFILYCILLSYIIFTLHARCPKYMV